MARPVESRDIDQFGDIFPPGRRWPIDWDDPPPDDPPPPGGDPPPGGGTPPTGVSALTPFNPNSFFPPIPLFGGNLSSEQAEAILRTIAASSAYMDAAQRNALFSALLPALLPYLQNGGEGFRPDALAAMRAEAIETTSGATRGARGNLMTELSRRGLRTGRTPVAGEGLRRIAEIDTAGGIETGRALREVTTKNEMQRLQNMFNSFNVAGGYPTNVAGNVNAGASVPEQRPGLGSSLASALLGAGVNAGLTGIGNVLGRQFPNVFGGGGSGGSIFGPITPPTFPCAVAIELYGEHDPRTILVRLWLVFHVEQSLLGGVLVSLYRRHGHTWAGWIRKSRLLRAVARKLFDGFAARARGWLNG